MKRAEIKLTAFFAEHNVAIQTADHLIELCKKMFHDSQIVKRMTLDKTKCTAILTNVIAKTVQEEIALHLQNTPFSVLVDESTDKSNDKNFCVLVKYIHPITGKSSAVSGS